MYTGGGCKLKLPNFIKQKSIQNKDLSAIIIERCFKNAGAGLGLRRIN